uniref:Uncharacterized protein n=1 Tax=Romanomermis culicivorax TaxID=13658 RepID=A0A915J7N5_ROMCU
MRMRNGKRKQQSQNVANRSTNNNSHVRASKINITWPMLQYFINMNPVVNRKKLCKLLQTNKEYIKSINN